MLEQLATLPPERKCFRLISGVLVERKVQDVTPTLKATSENLKNVLEDLLKQYKRQQEEMEKWKVWSRAQLSAHHDGMLTIHTEKEQSSSGSAMIA